jgi:hypothetical protein
MPTLTAAKAPAKRSRKTYVNASFHAPYERHTGTDKTHRLSCGRDHGGYGILAEGYIHGPFFFYEYALNRVARLTGTSGRVVRWVDYVAQSSRETAFCSALVKLTDPLTFPVYGKGVLAPVVWRETPRYSRACR